MADETPGQRDSDSDPDYDSANEIEHDEDHDDGLHDPHVDPLIGRVVGGCRLEEQLGVGDNGLLYRGTHQGMGMKVVIRLIPQSLPGFRASQIERFLRSGRAMAKLNLPHVVRVFNVGCEDDLNFVVMDYIDGQNLKQLLEEQGALDLEVALEVIEQVLQALEAAHSQAVIHRDIKPSSVLLEGMDGDGASVKLADLGLAKFNLTDEAEEGGPVTISGTMMGEASYIAPEQAQDAKNVTFSADIYSVGCVLYEMVTGQKPYSAKSAVQVMLMHVQAKVPKASDIVPELDSRVVRVIRKMMAKKPASRYESATEALRAVRRLQGKRVVQPKMARKVESDVAPSPTSSPVVAGPATPAHSPVLSELPPAEPPQAVDDALVDDSISTQIEESSVDDVLGASSTVDELSPPTVSESGTETIEESFVEPRLTVDEPPEGIDTLSIGQMYLNVREAMDAKRMHSALALIDEILKADPDNPDAGSARVQCQASLQRAEPLGEQLKILAETNDLISIQSICQNILEFTSDDPVALALKEEADGKLTAVNEHLATASGYLQTQQWAEAIDEYKAALEVWALCPDAQSGLTVAEEGLRQSDLHEENVQQLLHAGKLDEAEAAIREVLAQSEWLDGEKHLEAIAERKQNAQAKLDEAATHKRSGNWADAVQALEAAQEIWAGNESLIWELGEVRSSLAKFEQAKGSAQEAVDARDLSTAETAIQDALAICAWPKGDALLEQVRGLKAEHDGILVQVEEARKAGDWGTFDELCAKGKEIWPHSPDIAKFEEDAQWSRSASSDATVEAQELMKARRLESAVPAIEKALSLQSWPEGEEMLVEARARLEESQKLVAAAAKHQDLKEWKLALNKLLEARVMNSEAVDEERIGDLKIEVGDLEHQLNWLRERAEEGRFMDVISESRELQSKHGDPEIDSLLTEAQEKEKQIKSMEEKAEELLADLDPAAAVQLYERILQLQPYRADSLDSEVESLNAKVEEAKTFFAEAKKAAHDDDWERALDRVTQALAINRHIISADELKEEAEREIEAQAGFQRLIKRMAIIGAVVVVVLLVAYLFRRFI